MIKVNKNVDSYRFFFKFVIIKNWYCILIIFFDCNVFEKLRIYEIRLWYCIMFFVGLGNW